jgi:hypothetical protein
VHFVGNQNLHRLLSDYGFNGYPLRKDFPPTGYLEAFYIEKVKVIQKHKLGLMQEMRESYFTATWGEELDEDSNKEDSFEEDLSIFLALYRDIKDEYNNSIVSINYMPYIFGKTLYNYDITQEVTCFKKTNAFQNKYIKDTSQKKEDMFIYRAGFNNNAR